MQIAGVVLVQVMVPLPVEPDELTVVVPRGRKVVEEAAAVMVWDASETVKVAAVEPAV